MATRGLAHYAGSLDAIELRTLREEVERLQEELATRAQTGTTQKTLDKAVRAAVKETRDTLAGDYMKMCDEMIETCAAEVDELHTKHCAERAALKAAATAAAKEHKREVRQLKADAKIATKKNARVQTRLQRDLRRVSAVRDELQAELDAARKELAEYRSMGTRIVGLVGASKKTAQSVQRASQRAKKEKKTAQRAARQAMSGKCMKLRFQPSMVLPYCAKHRLRATCAWMQVGWEVTYSKEQREHLTSFVYEHGCPVCGLTQSGEVKPFGLVRRNARALAKKPEVAVLRAELGKSADAVAYGECMDAHTGSSFAECLREVCAMVVSDASTTAP